MYKIREIDGGIVVENVCDFNLFHIFECGQCFRWLPDNDGGYRGVAFSRFLKIYYCESENELTLLGANTEDFNNIWRKYFDLDTDYLEIKAVFSAKDKYMRASTEFGHGIRLLKQDPFETLISFIISANNNIPRIRKCINLLSETYGEPIVQNNETAGYSFPKPEVLAKLTEQEISDCCRAGYRCKYIIEASRQYLTETIDINKFSEMTKESARKEMSKYMGVGPKVADCILLFTGARKDVFPVDVWVAKLMNALYMDNEQDRKKIEMYASDYFGERAGLAQQYLFFYAREHFDKLINTI